MGLQKPIGKAAHEPESRKQNRDAAGLLAQLEDADASTRRWAARDLSHHPQAASAVGLRLMKERDSSVRECLLTCLQSFNSDGAVNALLPLLRSEDAALRNGAIESLAAMPDVAGKRIDDLLLDADPDVRIFTVNLLGDLKHTRVPDWLRSVLTHERQVNVVAAAIEVLAEVGSAKDLAALSAARQRFADDPFIAFAAEHAAKQIESP